MLIYKFCGLLVLLGCIALAAGVFMGISPSANYFVESAFSLFAISAATFVVYVILGLAKEFRETA